MKITLKRPKQFADRGRSYLIAIDGRNTTYLRPKESKEIEAPPGARRLTAHLDWATGNAIDLTKLSSDATIAIKNSVPGDVWIPFLPTLYMFAAPQSYLKLEIAPQRIIL
ncbi:MAG TPA: hypothetical protein VNH64_05855 [Parvularculaceae bacterium]|nr:hypothetical protein [Parvularculaceae bacterium]